jgi:Sec-independent protein translocase protein TatA
MFGVGPQEMVIIGLMCLLIFGPGKFTEMARQLGRFSRKVSASVDELKSELDLAKYEDSNEDLEPEEDYHDYESHEESNSEVVPVTSQ